MSQIDRAYDCLREANESTIAELHVYATNFISPQDRGKAEYRNRADPQACQVLQSEGHP